MAWISPESMSTLMYDPEAEKGYADYVSQIGRDRKGWTRQILNDYVSNELSELASRCAYEFPTSNNGRGWTLFVPPFVGRLPISDRDFFNASTVDRKLDAGDLVSSKQMSLDTKLPYVKLNVFCDQDGIVTVNGSHIVKRVNVGEEGAIYVLSKSVIY